MSTKIGVLMLDLLPITEAGVSLRLLVGAHPITIIRVAIIEIVAIAEITEMTVERKAIVTRIPGATMTIAILQAIEETIGEIIKTIVEETTRASLETKGEETTALREDAMMITTTLDMVHPNPGKNLSTAQYTTAAQRIVK